MNINDRCYKRLEWAMCGGFVIQAMVATVAAIVITRNSLAPTVGVFAMWSLVPVCWGMAVWLIVETINDK